MDKTRAYLAQRRASWVSFIKNVFNTLKCIKWIWKGKENTSVYSIKPQMAAHTKLEVILKTAFVKLNKYKNARVSKPVSLEFLQM